MIFLKIQVKACVLIHSISTYIFWGNYPILLLLPNKIGKIAIQRTCYNVLSQHVSKEQ